VGKTVSLFVNPTAGRGRAGRRLPQIETLFADAGLATDAQQSVSIGDLEALVRRAVEGGARDIVVAGGDGSIHEAVNGMLAAGDDARLGVIPTGTGNDFAKACGIPLDWQQAARDLAARLSSGGGGHRIDAGRMNGRFFANGAGIGFDAKVTRVAQAYRWPIGDLVYLVAILRCMLDGIASPHVEIRTRDFAWSGPVTLASISNGPWIGGMFHIAPMARNDDGRLELLIADPVTRRRICMLLPKLVRGRHMDEKEITHTGITALTIEATAPLASHLDGEVQPLAQRFEIEVLPGALKLL